MFDHSCVHKWLLCEPTCSVLEEFLHIKHLPQRPLLHQSLRQQVCLHLPQLQRLHLELLPTSTFQREWPTLRVLPQLVLPSSKKRLKSPPPNRIAKPGIKTYFKNNKKTGNLPLLYIAPVVPEIKTDARTPERPPSPQMEEGDLPGGNSRPGD